MAYAQDTEVPAERSRAEIERTLNKYGATKFFYGTSPQGAGIAFEFKGRVIQLSVPNPNERKFATPKKWEAERRRMWRVLLLAMKAKLELINAGLATFEDEFLAQTALPNGGTVSQWLQPQLLQAIQSRQMPQLALPCGQNNNL
jgi:hypothetical protein